MLGSSHAGGPAALWRGPDNRDWVVWASSGETYEVARLAADGGISVAAKTALHWTGVTNDPTLLGDGEAPLLVFSGGGPGKQYSLGCVVGAQPGTSSWTPQTWSLSNDCDASGAGYGSAARNAKGVLSAAWAAIGGGVQYRIGISNSIPAPTPDTGILIGKGATGSFSEAVDSRGSDDFYVAFARFFAPSTSDDGVFVKDLSANGTVTKAPGSGENPDVLQRVAFANSTSPHGGIYAAYCSNDSSCSRLFLWHYGAKKAIVVPQGGGAKFVAMSSGPDGRLWLSWWNEGANRLYTVRTNKADTRFGPVESYSTSFLIEFNDFALSSGNFGRLDIVVNGVDSNTLKPLVLATQSLTALAVSPGRKTIDNASSNKVIFTVTDAGDRVSGAVVSVDGHRAATSAAGTATISFAKGTKPGKFDVTAAATNYFPAGATLEVSSGLRSG
jgi:hypothetical protein